MYNRYTPQADGTYQKHCIPEPPPAKSQPFTSQIPDQTSPADCNQQKQSAQSVGSFLKQLLPKNIGTADLIILLLLLLMASENEENRSSALLTLALYFFM